MIVDKVLRVREMYQWFISNPNGSDREFVAKVCQNATDDPRVLGIEPIPNIQRRIDEMIDKYRRETINLEFDTLFPDEKESTEHSKLIYDEVND